MTTAEQLTVPEIKQCSACKFFLPVMEFYWVNKAGEGLRRGQCKACMKTLKAAQRDPDWRPSCSRCGGLMSARTGPGRRLCDTCFGETYDVVGQRDNGAHRIRLKPCSLCGGPKERFERGRFCRTCKPWESYASNLRRFGLTPAEYVAILDAQGGACYVCGTRPADKRLCIDHDHSMPEGRASVRGLLCGECNYNRLPRFAEDIAMLQRAVAYLTEPPARAILTPGVDRSLAS